ncbi:hypothetical protein FGO68_gene13660 [Halteria grandinella]|uniref:Uncharacterized protein n=1 Tax=Halteria grandinella TaxID=5974 RepID=A0A8J8T3U9_HALGN|nr:hypothetical protein FGO68_gene13660 [Halteria grandinella]
MSSSEDDDQFVPKSVFKRDTRSVSLRAIPFKDLKIKSGDDEDQIENGEFDKTITRFTGEGPIQSFLQDSMNMIEDSNQMVILFEKISVKMKESVLIIQQKARQMITNLELKVLRAQKNNTADKNEKFDNLTSDVELYVSRNLEYQ